MRRTRLDTTAYGDVQPLPETEISPPAQPKAADERGRDDRWVIRRTALSRQLVLDAQALFEERLKRPISENEARNLLGNLGDYMWMLVKWEVSPSAPGREISERRPRGRARKNPKPDTPPRPRGRPPKNPERDSR